MISILNLIYLEYVTVKEILKLYAELNKVIINHSIKEFSSLLPFLPFATNIH